MPDGFYIGRFYHNTYIAHFFHLQKRLDMAPIPIFASDVMPSLEKLMRRKFRCQILETLITNVLVKRKK
jgi:hypothetical protein